MEAMREEGQVSPDEHLERIIAKCREVIELGEERTKGRWDWSESAGIADVTGQQINQLLDSGSKTKRRNNGLFIAACAGPAEAAARSTIAAIELIREVANEDGWASVKHYVDIIRAAWPFEIL